MPQYIRVKDKDTKHEFDVPKGSPLLSKGLVEPVKSDLYPESPVPRPPKHYLKPAGQSSAAAPKTAGQSAAATPKES